MREAIDARAPGLINRVTDILIKPGQEWDVISNETTTAGEIYTGYVAILGAIGPIATLIGMSLIGVSVPFLGHMRTPILPGVATMILTYALTFLSVLLVAWLVNALAPTFGGQKDSLRALKVTAYSYTAAWVAGVLHLLPTLGLLVILAALYGLYTLYLGLPVMMRCPKDKALGYTVVTVICVIVISAIISMVTTGIIFALGLSGANMLGGGMGMHFGGKSSMSASDSAAGAAVLSSLFGGKSEQDKARVQGALQQLEKLGKQSEPAASSPNMAGQVDPAQALNAMGQVLSGGQKVQTVDFRELKAMLPASLPGGLQRTDASGERGEAMGMQTSHATGHYSNNAGSNVTIEITDMGSMAGLAGLALKFNPNVEKETDAGYERTTTVNGQMTHEKYNRQARHGEVSAIVANRFSVEVRGSGVEMDMMKQALGQIDMSRLTAVAQAQ